MKRMACAIAAAALLGAAGCSNNSESEADTRAGIDRLADLTETSIESFDCTALAGYDGTLLGDNSKVTELFRAMPTGADMDTFEILGDEGVLVVNYSGDPGDVDPSTQDEALAAISECAREYVTNLKTVRYMVPQGNSVVTREF